MACNEQLASMIREALSVIPGVDEQQKMGGCSFMVNGRVCVRAHSDGNMLIRCRPDMMDELLTKKGTKRFEMRGKPMMKGWLLIDPEAIETKNDFDYWINISIDFIKAAAATNKRKSSR